MLTNFTTFYYTTVMNSAVGPITEFKSESNYKHWSMQTIMSSSSNHYCCRRFRACCKLSYCRFAPFPLCFLFYNLFHYRAKPSAVYRCISSRIQKCNMPFMLLFLLLFLHQFILLFCHLLFSPPPCFSSSQWGKFDCLLDHLNYFTISATLLNTPHNIF